MEDRGRDRGSGPVGDWQQIRASGGFVEKALSISAQVGVVQTTGNCGNSRMTFSGGWNRMPPWASPSMAVSLYESPAATMVEVEFP